MGRRAWRPDPTLPSNDRALFERVTTEISTARNSESRWSNECLAEAAIKAFERWLMTRQERKRAR